MTPCTVPTGFFLLSACGRPSVGACTRCRRPVCEEHRDESGLCPECLAAAQENAPGPYDRNWSHRYRRDYYERIQDVYEDATWYARLDDYDRGAFDQGAEHSYGGDDLRHDDDSGFVDS